MDKIPDWFTEYADWYAPSDRCSYCWWARGALSHWILGVLFGVVMVEFWPLLSIVWCGAAITLMYLQLTDRYEDHQVKAEE